MYSSNNGTSSSKFNSKILFQSGTIGRIRFIEGVRTFMSIIVILHHIDLINPRINKVSNIIWTIDKVGTGPNLEHDLKRNLGFRNNIKIFVDDDNDHNNMDRTEIIHENNRNLLSKKGKPSHGNLHLYSIVHYLLSSPVMSLHWSHSNVITLTSK